MSAEQFNEHDQTVQAEIDKIIEVPGIREVLHLVLLSGKLNPLTHPLIARKHGAEAPIQREEVECIQFFKERILQHPNVEVAHA